MLKRIVLCADDFGQAPAISKGILYLLEQKRLSATSCIVNSAYWQEHGSWLQPFRSQVDLGLHLNLTQGRALSKEYIDNYGMNFFSLELLLRKSFFHQIKTKIIEAECVAQIERFHEVMGFYPTFIDGHQHVHQFPVIRQALLNAYKLTRLQNSYLRLAVERLYPYDFMYNSKKILINSMGKFGLKPLLYSKNIPYNSSFAGLYPFRKSKEYESLFKLFIQHIRDGGIILCHPGLHNDALDDDIAHVRVNEYAYLSSQLFLIDCQNLNIKIDRFQNCVVQMAEA